MRIVHVMGSLLAPVGGAEQYLLELTRAQSAAGHEVTVLTGWATPGIVSALEADDVAVELVAVRRPYPPDRRGSRPAAVLFHALDLIDSVRTPKAVRRVLDSRWDVVHVHRVAGLGAGLMRSTRAPVVVTVHDYSLVDTRSSMVRDGVIAVRQPLIQRARARIMSRAAARATFVFASEALRDRHEAWGITVPAGSVVIPHGWRVGVRARTATRSAEGPVVFLFLGKLLASKGVPELLEAWGDGIPGAELWFGGSGELDAAVHAAAATGRVRQLGWLDATGRDTALAAASALVLPSTGPEIFLLAAAEGALAGLPVISTRVASPPSVRDGLSGLLVTPDAAALRAAMERLLDPAERARLASGARLMAEQLDFDAHVARVSALYARVAGRVSEVAR